MRIFGSIRELVRMVIRTAGGDTVNIEAAEQTNSNPTVTIPNMGDSADTFVLNDTAATLTNKSIDADANTITNIEDADIKSGANIAVNKLASVTASRALESDGSGKLSASSVTSTELGYLSGVSSAVQTQLNNKQPLDSELTALAGLTSAADTLPYFTGSGTAALTTLTSFSRNLLDDASASDARSTLGAAASGTNTDIGSLQNVTLNGMSWNDVSPVDISSGTIVVTSSTIVHQITVGGTLSTILGGTDGMIIVLQNTLSTDVVIANNSGTTNFQILTGTGSNLTLKSGASILLRFESNAVGSQNDNKWYVLGGAGSGGGLTPSIITGATTAVSGTQYFTNHSTSFEIALPSAPNIGDTFEIVDYANNWDTKPVTLNPANASHSINGAAANENFILDVRGVWVRVTYVDTNNWRVIDPIDPALSVTGPNAVIPVSSDNYTLSNVDHSVTIAYTTGASNRTLTLPAAASNAGKAVEVKKVDSGVGTVIIDPNASETVDGASTFTLTSQWDSVRLRSDGSNWLRVDAPLATSTQSGLVNPYITSGAGVVYGGTYTPTASNTSNCSVTPRSCVYSRVGPIVTVSGAVDVDITASGGYSFQLSLPIASDFTSSYDAAGTGNRKQGSTYQDVSYIQANVANNTLFIEGSGTDVDNEQLVFTCQYRIL